MKKIILILFLFNILFLAGCGSDNTYTTPVQDNPIINQPENNPQEEIPEPVNLQLKEFTVEGDDLGLYPSTLTVNKGDIVKITFKVRNEKVYYGGLDFRSDVWGDTGKILPGNEKTVEFNAENSFTYTSYWPATNKLKATGTINVL
ncbi:MAG: hypothetical protein AABW45_02150 [Nanoarchaeota archaeon]